MNKRQELELLMLEKEKRRRASAVKSEELTGDVARRAKEVAVDVPISVAQTASLGFGDEAIGHIAAVYKKSTGDERSYEDIYTEAKTSTLEKVEGARKRSPVSTFIADMVTPNPLKFFKATKAAGPIISSLIEGYGQAEGEDIGTQVAISGGIGAATKILGGIGKKTFGEPAATEARFLGLDSAEADLKKGPGYKFIDDVNQSLKRLRSKGMFSKSKSTYSAKANKWRTMGGKSKTISPRAADVKDIEIKMDRAAGDASKRVEKILESKSVSFSELNMEGPQQGLLFDEETIMNFGKEEGLPRVHQILEKVKSLDVAKVDEAKKVIQNSFDNISRGTGTLTLTDVHREKQRLYKLLSGKFGEESTGVQETVRKDLARMYKDMVDHYADNDEVRGLNETMSDIFNFKSGVTKKVKEKFLTSPIKDIRGASVGGLLYRAERGMESFLDVYRPYRSKAGRMYEGIPEGGRDYLEGVGGLAPARAMNREPQSIPEELIRTKFPRTTEAILENKDTLLAKIAQQAPDMFDAVQEVFEHSPEDIPDIMPALIQMAGFLFKKDKYNRFDGVILDPQLKELARKDVMKHDNLSNVEKIEILDKLNKTGEYPL